MNLWSDPRLTRGPCHSLAVWDAGLRVRATCHREDDGCRLGAAVCAFLVCSDFLVQLIRTAHL